MFLMCVSADVYVFWYFGCVESTPYSFDLWRPFRSNTCVNSRKKNSSSIKSDCVFFFSKARELSIPDGIRDDWIARPFSSQTIGQFKYAHEKKELIVDDKANTFNVVSTSTTSSTYRLQICNTDTPNCPNIVDTGRAAVSWHLRLRLLQ